MSAFSVHSITPACVACIWRLREPLIFFTRRKSGVRNKMSLVGYGHIIGEAGVPPIRSGSLIVLGYELSFVPYPTRVSDLEGRGVTCIRYRRSLFTILNIVTHCGAGGRQQIGQAESTLHPCGTEVISVPVLQAVWEWPARLRDSMSIWLLPQCV